MRHAATAVVLLSLAGTAHASPNSNKRKANNRLRGRRRQLQAYLQSQQTRQLQNQNEQQGQQQGGQEKVTRWDNDRISESNPDGLPTDPATGKLDCWPNCYADHYDGPADAGGGNVGGGVKPVEYNRNAGTIPAQTEQADTIDRGIQIALDAVEKYRSAHPVNPYFSPSNANTNTYTEESRETTDPSPSNPYPNIVYDPSTGHQYDLTTGQQIVVEEVEEVHTGQADVKVYVIEEQLPPPATSAGGAASSGPLADPTPTTTYASTITGAATSTPTTDFAPAQCILPRNSPCSTNDSCASGCCAVLAQSTKCVDPSIAVFAQFCPKDNPCGGRPGTKVPKVKDSPKTMDVTATYVHSATPQSGGGDSDNGGGDVLYTLGPGGTFITASSNNVGSPNPSNPNRIEGGAGPEASAVDCTIQRDDWPMGKVPQGDDCAASCQCKTGCCVQYWAQICVDPTANNGHWADKCI